MDQIIEMLAAYSAADPFATPVMFNPWRDLDPLDTRGTGSANLRIDRLRQHFDCSPRFLLVGEAPGYQGCHFSGVPFTNEKLILDGVVPRVTSNGRITRRALPWSEPSATVVWRTLHRLQIAERTVMWNAFPYHPHKPGEPMSNRRPTRDELEAGREVLRLLIEHFGQARVVAVGRVAELALAGLGTGWTGVRHPSMGGATEFAAGMARVVAEGIRED